MKRAIHTDKAPAAIGPYSQAMEVSGGKFIFCSGQIALDPTTGELNNGSLEEETEQVLKNLGAVLEAAGASYDDVVKTTVFLADMADYQAVNALYATRFGKSKPARAAVAAAGLPKGVRIEIEAIAVV